jgi:preprotein translocase subunit SecD
MSARTGNFFASKFFFWLLFAVFGSYFLFSVKAPHGESKFAPLLRGDVKGFAQTLYMPRVKLGIDLQGGTYLVLSVGVEKAIENRLVKEHRHLEGLFKQEGLKDKPASIKAEQTKMHYLFETEEQARVCYHFIKKHAPMLSAKQKDLETTVSLNPADEQNIRNGVVDQAVNVLQNRLNGFGVAGLIVQRHGERQIVVQLPGVSDPERVKSLITKTALLEFKMVEKMGSVEDLLDEYDGDLPSDKMIVKGQKEGDGAYLVSAYPDMTGDHISDANIGYDEYGRIQVTFGLDSAGATHFKRLTGDNIGRSLGIIIDNVMYSAPRIESAIGSRGSIHGQYTAEEARDLSLVLRSGSLLAPLQFEQENRVGASLGQDSIEKGIWACLFGLLLVLLFSFFYYRAMGVFAMVALVYNLFLILLFLSYFESTLTLPGIAGMVLTIGMAIDASILIYEKIREDLNDGVSFRQAVKSGFNGAMMVILDSNITTFLAGLILFKFGGPAIKGFAITLMAGIIATMASGVFFLRSLITYILDLRGGRGFKF